MTLHHRPDIEDMRSVYDIDNSVARSYTTSQSDSERSYRTAPSEYSERSAKRPPRMHHTSYSSGRHSPAKHFAEAHVQEHPRASAESYTSTIASEADEPEEAPDYDVPQYSAQQSEPSAIAATPADFSELFPSQRRLAVRHDDSTLDGNMNLRIDTEVNIHGRRREMTLFHLRMHDLRDREFSLRRYCRDSGREVCHSSRKLQKPSSERRPGLPRTLSNALSGMRSRSEQKTPTLASLKRNDSGYGSINSSSDFDRETRPHTASSTPKPQAQIDFNSIHLEFSNYAHVDIKRAGTKGNKRYEFEYWGTQYAWRRTMRKVGDRQAAYYQLTKIGAERPLAHIIPSPLTPAEAEEEHRLGGWVPPCSMWIADEELLRSQKDVADVVVATGLMTLVDDSIKLHFHSKESKQIFIPKLQMGVEYIGPKRLINEMFKRDTSNPPSGHGRHLSISRLGGSSPITLP